MKPSFTLKLVLSVATTVTVIYASAAWYDYRLTREHILENSRLEASQLVDSAIADLTANLRGVQKSTDVLATVLSAGLPDKERLQSLLHDIVRSRNDLYGAAIAVEAGVLQDTAFAPYYFHKNGETLYADLSVNDYRLEQQQWYTLPRQTGKAGWTSPYFDDGGGQTLMSTYTAPVWADGQVIGVITADFTLERLNDYLRRIRLGKTGFAMLLTPDGQILSHPDPATAMRNITEVYPALTQNTAWSGTVSKALGGAREIIQLPCPHVADTCLTGYSLLSETGWVLYVLYPQQEMLSELHQYSLRLVVIASSTVLLLLITITAISRRLTSPLVALAAASSRFGEGDLDATLPASTGSDEVSHLIRAFAHMRLRLKEFIAKLETETAARNRLQGELKAAHQIQMAMLPHGGNGNISTAGLEVWARLIPAKSVGGDLYTWLDTGKRKLLLVVGDVSDKGVAAALFMARTLTLVQEYVDNDYSPSEALARLNDRLLEHNDTCMFVTLFYGVIDMDSGRLEFASGGHTPPLLRHGGAVSVIPQEHGPAIGLCEGASFPANVVQLHDGDLLCVYTDGIDEAFNTAGEQFGHDRLQNVLAQAGDACEAVGEDVMTALRQFTQGAPQSDDITLLLTRWQAAPRRPLLDDAVSAVSPFVFDASLSALDTLFGTLSDWLASQHLHDDGMLHDLKLVAEEIFVNIINYGQLSPDAHIEVMLGRHTRGVLLEFIDEGIAWNPLQDADEPVLGLNTEEAAIGGLGVFLVRELTDEQAYRREHGANRFCVIKYLP